LTSLPVPRPSVLAPAGLTQNTGTAELFRLQDVRAIVTGDFIVLPCDLISELGGEGLLEAWMILQAGLGGVTGGRSGHNGPKMSISGERGGRRGGIGVWYETRGEGSAKNQETDFIATVPLPPRPIPPAPGSIMANLFKVVIAMPTDTLKDTMTKNGSFSIRKSLLRKHPKVRMLMTQRDAHIYFFPHWVLDMMKHDKLDSISEDVIGWWAKATWQDGLGAKLGLRETLERPTRNESEENMAADVYREEEIDLASLSSTKVSRLQISAPRKDQTVPFASRIGDSKVDRKTNPKPIVPNMLAYIHPRRDSAPLIRRVDTSALLLTVSLHLAKLGSVEDVGSAASPLAHANKIAYPAGVAHKTTITKSDCLLADNVTVDERAVIKQSVIGANCKIGVGVRLTRCLLMDGAVIGERCQLDGCIIGRRSRIGKGSILRDCEVQDGFVVPDGGKLEIYYILLRYYEERCTSNIPILLTHVMTCSRSQRRELHDL
jgi:translation initiation factor eIF-2B subunit gamma